MSDASDVSEATTVGRYVFYSAALGAVLPIVGTLLEIGARGLSLDVAGILSAQGGQPLLWIIDSAPIVLGCSAWLTGRRVAVESAAGRDRAEAVSRAKSEFLADMSHEIRTPMNGVLGMTQLLLDTELSAEQREFAEAVDESAKILRAVIDDLLDFSKIETDKLALESRQFRLRETLYEPLKTFARRATEKGLDLVYDEDERVPSHLVGDQRRVRQVFVNLVDNAVRYTESGDIVVRLGLERLDDDLATISFTVSDTGPGLDDETKARIFDAFSRGDGSHTQLSGGTGLGLPISERLVRMMGGSVAVESTPGGGSTFRIEMTLPLARLTDTVDARHAFGGQRALVLDDNASSARVLAGHLKRWGIVPITVESVQEALAQAQEMHAQGRTADIALVDLDTAGQDGPELCRRLATNGDLGPVRSVVTVSARHDADVDALDRVQDSTAHLLKPVFPFQLLEVLMEGVQSGLAVAPSSAADADGRRGTHGGALVLLAEDNPVNRLLAEALLKRRGHEVTLASNGREAVELFEQEEFDLVVMDVQMPEMDGLEATRRIRELESGRERRVPIIAVTAHSMKGDRELCLTAGMDEYVAKPIDPDELDEAIGRRYLSDPPDFEHGRALELLSGDEDLLASVVRVFLERTPERLVEIHEALDRRDSRALEETAHTIEGTADRLAMPRLRDVAHRIAVLSQRGELEEAAALVAELDAAVGSGTSAVRSVIDAA